jgi:hypothetical protein
MNVGVFGQIDVPIEVLRSTTNFVAKVMAD